MIEVRGVRISWDNVRISCSFSSFRTCSFSLIKRFVRRLCFTERIRKRTAQEKKPLRRVILLSRTAQSVSVIRISSMKIFSSIIPVVTNFRTRNRIVQNNTGPIHWSRVGYFFLLNIIPPSPGCLDIDRASRRISDFFPDVLDMNHNGTIAHSVIIPDALINMIQRINFLFMGHQ